MDYDVQIRKLGRGNARRWLFLVGLVAITHLLLQSFLIPYGKAIRSLLPQNELEKEYNILTVHSSTKSVMVRNPLTVNASDLIDMSVAVELEDDLESFSVGEELGNDALVNGNDVFEDISELQDFQDKNASDMREIEALIDIKGDESDDKRVFVLEQKITEPNTKISKENVLARNVSLSSGKSDGVSEMPNFSNVTFLTTLATNELASLASASQLNDPVFSAINSTIPRKPKLMACNMPPKTVTTFEAMNKILTRHRAKSRAMRPQWASPRDQEILAAKVLIEHAPAVKNDKELYAPLFRNISVFKKSYELMERTLKVYVYKEGEKPIFHQPILKGLYASEGWFMKLMEGNKQFSVKDPKRAHLFYMPFSSRMLEFTLYVRNSHNRTNLRQYLRHYSENIAAKYRYWNRTGGADHFLVACHDWAPYETRHYMEHCMKALCNADVTVGFKIGRDVSLPETYVRSARNPLRDLGGKPPSERHVLAFYAGNLHGYLRPILLKHWKDKHPDMKIFGPMPPGVASKMNYIEHMKSSKYCICPKGYEVNSPRVVEAIFYECVPVIISDNFVPPFMEVLNWDTFSIILAEKDIPKLRDVLLSIPKEKYIAMQLAVRKAQKHFLWHAKPVKYDLFHMTLHSIWYNRVFQLKPR